MSQTKFKPVDEQLAYLMKGVADVVPGPLQQGQSIVLQSMEPLSVKLERSRATKTPLRVKLGVDPTAPDIHLGHTVVIRKLKHFQEMGHTPIFLIGDFTALVGDPSGQSETRPPLSREQIKENAQTYLDQVFKILDREKTEVRFNSEWLDKLTSYDIVRLCGKYRVARMLEREDFRSRLRNNQPISMHELLYPLFQAYDSVALEADVELGATEQKFNLLIGRDIQREYYLERGVMKGPQVALMMPILIGLDGQRKMSKSFGNYVGITEPPPEMFGKIMSIPDDLMESYYELLTESPTPVAAMSGHTSIAGKHPIDAKMDLAREVVASFHGKAAAQKAAAGFQRVFRERQAPEEMEEILIKPRSPVLSVQFRIGFRVTKTMDITGLSTSLEKWSRLLTSLGLTASSSEAERLIKQGGFEIDDRPVQNPSAKLDLTQTGWYKLRLGKKKFVRIVVESAQP